MDLLTVQEAAAILKVHPETVRRHIASGRLPAVRVGRCVRVPQEALEALAIPIAPKEIVPMQGMMPVYARPPSEPLSEEQIRERQEAIEASERLIQEMRARRGGVPLPPSWPLIRESREERSAQI